ncbi:hypothetical protein BW730_09930 [Tessaracoccus aquimaris]|uniref:ABC transporter permease n=1 Tax=Tessaracoccus aquimaris TaxID=1332264 RepID=A0A1Q2CNR2_9ACTN|nr:ABC transporter permease subunit [Tessaracoccus aquimaris]AQP47762.1 hypothetical protein BW730_09930 [Tessaracoccus aquimaris]
MSTAVFGRGLAEGWRGLTIAAGSVAAMLVLGLAVYQDLDLSIYEGLPDVVRSLLGIPQHADASLMAYNEMLAAIGALAFVGVAIAIGAFAVAGEEANRTLSMVLAAPVSRTRFALSKAAAMLALLIASGALLWGVAAIAPIALGVEVGQAHVFALMLHLTANAIFHGSLAFAIGAATGRKGLAAGVAASVMVLGWLGTGLLPIWRENAADWIPWYWFNGSKPLVNGIDGGQLALLLVGAAILIGLGVLGFRGREVRLFQSGSSLLDRARAVPALAKVLQPTGKGSSLFGLRLAAQQVLVSYVVFILALVMGVAMPFMYKGLASMMTQFSQSFPQSMADLFGGGDLATPPGFLHLETFGMMAPIGVILVAAAAAASGIAGEERARRMSTLLAQPISRTRVYLTVAAATAAYVGIVAGSLFLGTWAGIAMSGMDVEIANLAWACGLLALLGLFFGALALLISAATGKPSLAVWATTAIAVVGFFGYTLLLAAGKEGWGWWSPFRAYLYGPPLQDGGTWWQPTWLAVGAVLLVAAGLPLFLRRDVRSGS